MNGSAASVRRVVSLHGDDVDSLAEEELARVLSIIGQSGESLMGNEVKRAKEEVARVLSMVDQNVSVGSIQLGSKPTIRVADARGSKENTVKLSDPDRIDHVYEKLKNGKDVTIINAMRELFLLSLPSSEES